MTSSNEYLNLLINAQENFLYSIGWPEDEQELLQAAEDFQNVFEGCRME